MQVLSNLPLIFFLWGRCLVTFPSLRQRKVDQAICLHNWQVSDLPEHDACVKLFLSSFLSKDGSYYYPS